jgi:hypothetical protein
MATEKRWPRRANSLFSNSNGLKRIEQGRARKTQYKADFLPAQAVLSRAGVQNYAVDREERVSSPFQAI